MNEKGAYMPENEKRDKLINRVVKLFRLGDASRNSSEGELMAAVTKAREFMALHNIEMVEVEGQLDESKAKELSIIVKEYTAYTRKGKFAKYDYSIMTAVSILTDTKVYMKFVHGQTGFRKFKRPHHPIQRTLPQRVYGWT